MKQLTTKYYGRLLLLIIFYSYSVLGNNWPMIFIQFCQSHPHNNNDLTNHDCGGAVTTGMDTYSYVNGVIFCLMGVKGYQNNKIITVPRIILHK